METKVPQLKVAVTGSTGLVGRRLMEMLRDKGHAGYGLRRGGGGEGARWDVETGEVVTPMPVDVVVHLAGRVVANRWTARVKREIWDSRVPATEKLCGFLARLPVERRPRLVISTSAIAVYGDRGDEVVTEDSPVAAKGASFLSDVCLGWEAATRAASEAGIKVVHVRVGIVLSKEGGALGKLALPTRLGLGGPVGPGTQFMPCISNRDLCRLLICMAEAEPGTLAGVVNGVGPEPVRQHVFMRTLGKVLHRPTIFPLPSFMVKLMFGQMGVESLLASYRVVATKLPAGFAYEDGTLEAAMRSELKK